jgi:predicted integral membrane protein DUF2269
MNLYPWIVILHVFAAFTFVLAHGASAMTAFRIRAERDPKRIEALLDLSASSLGLTYGALIVLLLAGIAAGIMGNWFGRGWIWAAIGVLVLVMAGMYLVATRYYIELRVALGQPKRGASGPPPQPVSPERLIEMLDTRTPETLLGIGGVGLFVLVWLMIAKPF